MRKQIETRPNMHEFASRNKAEAVHIVQPFESRTTESRFETQISESVFPMHPIASVLMTFGCTTSTFIAFIYFHVYS